MTITKAELNALNARLDATLAPHSANIKLTLHFGIDRINDPRNVPPITVAELEDVFMRFIAQHINAVLALKDNDTFNIRCAHSHINMPCGIRKYPTHPKNRIAVVTIMRKSQWVSKDPHDFLVG